MVNCKTACVLPVPPDSLSQLQQQSTAYSQCNIKHGLPDGLHLDPAGVPERMRAELTVPVETPDGSQPHDEGRSPHRGEYRQAAGLGAEGLRPSGRGLNSWQEFAGRKTVSEASTKRLTSTLVRVEAASTAQRPTLTIATLIAKVELAAV